MPFAGGDAGWVLCTRLRPFHFLWRTQPFLQIVAGAVGTNADVEWRQNGNVRRHALKPCEVWLLPAGIEHTVRWHKAAPAIICLLTAPCADELTGANPIPAGVHTLQDLINREVALGLIWEDLSDDGLKPCRHRLIAGMAWASYVLRAVRKLEIPVITAADERWSDVRQRLDAHFLAHLSDAFSLAGAARAVGISRWHLAAMFKARTGMTPRYYFNRLRVLRAKELLQAGHMVKEVMHALGSRNASKFRQMFRRHLKRDPGWFRPQPRAP